MGRSQKVVSFLWNFEVVAVSGHYSSYVFGIFSVYSFGFKARYFLVGSFGFGQFSFGRSIHFKGI